MAHQAKRQYAGSQPSITSYFSAATSPASYNISSHHSSPSTIEGCFPALPPSVQSNLLNVGMRVRKSVPEGYKTISHIYSPFFTGNENVHAAVPVVGQVVAPAIVARTRPRAGARELTPFCGIMKVGGMAQQEGGIYSDEEMEDDDDLPFLSSQGSTISNVGVATSVREKRRFSEDEHGEDLGFGFANRNIGERILAVPRRRGVSSGKMAVRGQENVLGVDGDFQEAEFLDYGLVGEVEMSG